MEELAKKAHEDAQRFMEEIGVKAKQKQKRQKKQDRAASSEWPYEISVFIGQSPKPKIAFLSGEEREYYPENPGHSKHAQVFKSLQNKGDSPPCMFTMPPIGVSKPISTLGYGMGGLLAKRFPKLNKRELRPDPGTYQEMHMYPARPDIFDFKNPLITKQCRLGFGSSLSVSRFAADKWVKPPGPGFYNFRLCSRCRPLRVKECFGTKRCLIPTVVTVCAVKDGERCGECGKEQKFDYYRSRTKVKHPDFKQPKFLVMCRKCYCRAWNGRDAFWTRKDILFIFQKARHCSYMHDHGDGLENFISKARPKQVAKLTLKESELSKYYGDCCHPDIKHELYF